MQNKLKVRPSFSPAPLMEIPLPPSGQFIWGGEKTHTILFSNLKKPTQFCFQIIFFFNFFFVFFWIFWTTAQAETREKLLRPYIFPTLQVRQFFFADNILIFGRIFFRFFLIYTFKFSPIYVWKIIYFFKFKIHPPPSNRSLKPMGFELKPFYNHK